jgi:hypothetical protein
MRIRVTHDYSQGKKAVTTILFGEKDGLFKFETGFTDKGKRWWWVRSDPGDTWETTLGKKIMADWRAGMDILDAEYLFGISELVKQFTRTSDENP